MSASIHLGGGGSVFKGLILKPGLEVIKHEFIIKLEIKRKQPINALYFEFETVLTFYNLEARPRGYKTFFMLNST